MSIIESTSVATFMMIVVFAVLLCLWGIIKAFSFVMVRIEGAMRKENAEERKEG